MRPLERLAHIPKEYHAQHEFCFWIHDQMVDVLNQCEARRIGVVEFSFTDDEEKQLFEKQVDLFEFLDKSGRHDVSKRIVLNQVVIPLYSDMLHFIYEALTTLERRKYAVTFALLRKPLKYSLLYASWLWADEDEFFDKMEKSPADHMDDRSLSHRRVDFLKTAISKFDLPVGLDADLLFQIIFDKNNAKGLAPYFDMAVHLVTSDKAIKTERLNLNFIFKSPNDTDIYAGIYYPLAYVLMYLFLLEIHTFGRMAMISKSYVVWAQHALLGVFEALFHEDDTTMLDMTNKMFEELLECLVCKEAIVIGRQDAPKLFMADVIECESCGSPQPFPFFWMMNRINAKESGEDTPP